MRNEHSEELTPEMRIALQGYRNPPPAPLNDMWSAIERAHFGSEKADVPVRRSRYLPPAWFAIAATVLLGVGIGIGRYTLVPRTTPPASAAVTSATAPKSAAAVKQTAPLPAEIVPPTPKVTPRIDVPYELATNRYLGETAALLAGLPDRTRPEGANPDFAAQAQDLLSTTRLLLDSPASKDPKMQGLLSDLELVLAQAVRLQADGNPEQLSLLAEAMKRREVLPRLERAVSQGTESF